MRPDALSLARFVDICPEVAGKGELLHDVSPAEQGLM
jgi:hypothetical protein